MVENYKYPLAGVLAILMVSQGEVLAEKSNTRKQTALSTIGKEEMETSKEDKQKEREKKKALQRELEEEIAYNRAVLDKKLAAIMAQMEQLRVEREQRRLNRELEEEQLQETHEKAMRLLRMEKEKLALEIELARVKFSKEMVTHNKKIAELEIKTQLERGQIQLLQESKNKLQTEIETFRTQTEREKHIQRKPLYLKDPLRKKDNVLVLSDRSIELTGYISPWKASYVVDQIQFFNNKDATYPIFLVIDESPGGSSEAGFRILQAMEGSKAPVYVVVRQYAASMAALIATLATKSYAFPNAQILHHQPSLEFWSFGKISLSLRRSKEVQEMLSKLWVRLGGRVAKKMGISLQAFGQKLFQKSMYGDWCEYGDQAKKLKWIDVLIHGIEDSGVTTLPDAADYTRERYEKKYWGMSNTQHNVDAEETMRRYYASTIHDFDYSYRPIHQRMHHQHAPMDAKMAVG